MCAVKPLLLYLLLVCNFTKIFTDDTVDPDIEPYKTELSNDHDKHNVAVVQNRLAAQLFTLIEHYKQPDPVGLPGSTIPDPFDVPDIKKGLGFGTMMNMFNVKAYGLSKFRIKSINIDLKEMKVQASIQLDKMEVKGKYTLSSFLSKANGPFVVNLKNVLVNGLAALSVQRDGHLTTERINMDITFSDMNTDFQNLGFLGSVFQNLANSAPTLVFDAMKPFILQEADKKIRDEINANINKVMGDRLLPNSITPLDMVISEGRKNFRALGYDPYHLPDYNRTVGVFSVQMSNTWITGISSFYRVGNMIVTMENNTIGLTIEIGTQEISGAAQWEVDCGIISKVGHVQFTVQHIRVTVNVQQALDIRKRPEIRDLQITLGNIQIRCDGAGTFDYVLEFLINILPNILRYQIVDALESPIKMRIQEKFNTIDVERALKENIDKFESFGSDFSFDFKL